MLIDVTTFRFLVNFTSLTFQRSNIATFQPYILPRNQRQAGGSV